MKRILLHTGFWILYLFQDVALIFLVDSSRLSGFTEKHRIILALGNALIILLPKLLFTYFLMYVLLDKLLAEKESLRWNILYSFLALAGTLLLYRALLIYVTYPVIYQWKDQSLYYFNLLGFLVALMDIGFASGAAIAIKQTRSQLKAKEAKEHLIRENLETELKFLRNQTNPHFLFNTLNNIYALARKKSDETPEVVLKLSKLLRFMLYETKKTFIQIGDEIKMLDDYIELERIRYNNKLVINFIRDIDNENSYIPPLLLLPLVENAFKHGVGESRYQSGISIDMKLKRNCLEFRIENTKESTDSEYVTENIGLSNLKRHLELMYREYELLVQNEATIFRVSLTINLNSHAKI